MTTNQSVVASLVQSLIGSTVIAAAKDGKPEEKYTIARLSDKLGTMKNGEKAEYVVLTLNGNTSVVMNLHPEHAKRLFKKGEDGPLTVVPKEDAADLSAQEQEDVRQELAADQAGTVTAQVEEVKAAPAKETKKVTKKDQFVALATKMIAEGKTRKDIAVEAAKIGVTGPGYNTYFQNFKSKKAGWTL